MPNCTGSLSKYPVILQHINNKLRIAHLNGRDT